MTNMPERITPLPLNGERVLNWDRATFHDSLKDFEHPDWSVLSLIAVMTFNADSESARSVELIRAQPKDALEPVELLVCDITAALAIQRGKSMFNMRKFSIGKLAVLYPSPRPFPIDFTGRFKPGETDMSDASTAAHIRLRRSGAVTLEPFCSDGIRVRANWSEAFGIVLPSQRQALPEELGKLSLVGTQSA